MIDLPELCVIVVVEPLVAMVAEPAVTLPPPGSDWAWTVPLSMPEASVATSMVLRIRARRVV